VAFLDSDYPPCLVERHQSNYLRLKQLRAAAETNDNSIRDTFRTLANARRDLKTTPTTVFPSGPNYPIQYGELLAFARRISKTTMPPPGVTNGVALDAAMTRNGTPTLGSGAGGGGGSTSQTPITSQMHSPAATGAAGASLVTSQTPSEILPPTQQTIASTNTSLPEGLSQHLNPLAGAVFHPWPIEDRIRGGSLAALQQLQDRGIDPRGYDPDEEERRRIKAEEERREREERERIQREEEERRMREERDRRRQEIERQREREQLEAFRRASVVAGGIGGAATGAAGVGTGVGVGTAASAATAGDGVPRSSTAGPGEKKQFQFTSIEDEDDEDDVDE
jgi:hypothetical protein